MWSTLSNLSIKVFSFSFFRTRDILKCFFSCSFNTLFWKILSPFFLSLFLSFFFALTIFPAFHNGRQVIFKRIRIPFMKYLLFPFRVISFMTHQFRRCFLRLVCQSNRYSSPNFLSQYLKSFSQQRSMWRFFFFTTNKNAFLAKFKGKQSVQKKVRCKKN